jgi:uncharacterized protein
MTEFTWNLAKAASNKAKHDISFNTARTIFSDPHRLSEVDDASHGEQRWTTIGRAADGSVILTVVHVDWEEDELEIIRIISARKATPPERKRYEQNRRTLLD